ncbi:hypothetical protein SAMN04487965_3122 [Microbulbifer donghaiensis]|uniref:Uncharacterized protein n=1 Tax=Microbulbifer donghaiensis TaxID=494016 RepID=A0A1M5G944_9GAMM|nr:DUF6116 family protein [Microbulbifer donghaiensis]SHG00236.1 hypothetical protein SAMN04487965_3122 [Microbulbifer donghaiensis]
MKRVLPSALVGWFLNYARKLEHPQLFKWICAIFLVDLFIPDLLPFVDEFLLGLATLYLASRKKRRSSTPGQSTKEKFAGRGTGEQIKENPPTFDHDDASRP